jgi:H+-transporting ATPase
MSDSRRDQEMSTDKVASLTPPTAPAKQAKPAWTDVLTGAEAQSRLEKDGLNTMPDTSAHPLRNAFAKFWAPVPWLLEASVVLEVALQKYLEAAVIVCLLIFNASAYFQEARAQATLTALKSRLALNTSVRRDGKWKIIPAA